MGQRKYGHHTIETSNEDKILYPDSGITKGEVIEYYERIAQRILPHLDARPLVVQRFPDGIGAEGFFQRQVDRHLPVWVSTVRVEVAADKGTQEVAVCDYQPTLVYLANRACLTLHPWLSLRDELDRPDVLIVDLDPAGDDFESARVAALRVRDLLEELGLRTYPKLTGSRGVHVTVPLERRHDFATVRSFARRAMQLLAERHPRELTTEQRKDKRQGRLYLDTGRNAHGQTAVAPWSLRALPGAPLAVPLAWTDLERRGISPRDYTLRNVFRRTAQRQDPWTAFFTRPTALEEPREQLKRLWTGEHPHTARRTG